MSGRLSRFKSARYAVRRSLGAGKPDRFSELASAAIKDDEGRLEAFIDDRQIGPPVTVEIAGRAHANPRFGCAYLARGREVAFAVVPKHDALAAIAMRHEQIERAITVKIRRYDGRCRLCRERFACGKPALAVVEADVTRSGDLGAFTGFHQVRIVAAVGGHDVRIAVTVQIRQGHVPCAPLGIAERAEFSEMALPIIQVDNFAIRRIVADHNVRMAVAIDIGQRRGIGAVGRRPQVTGDEAAMTIVQEHAIEEGPMPPFAKNDVR